MNALLMALILIACERSQLVCKAFRAAGHEAYSNDTEDCYGGHPEWHIKGCALEAVKARKWDMLIGHPPCTYLSYVANRFYRPEYNQQLDLFKGKYDRHDRREEAFRFFMELWRADIPMVCLENPMGIVQRWFRKPDQWVHPYYFGHDVSKRTGLWLRGLPPLEPTDVRPKPKPLYFTSTKGKPVQWVEGIACGNAERKRLRSQTFEGIALAMAHQWGALLQSPINTHPGGYTDVGQRPDMCRPSEREGLHISNVGRASNQQLSITTHQSEDDPLQNHLRPAEDEAPTSVLHDH